MTGIPSQRPAREPCVVDGCAIPGRHVTACPDPATCRGCLPGLATVGLLCGHHHRRLERDLAGCPELWEALTVRLASSGRAGQRVSGSRDPGLVLDERVMDARTRLRDDLQALCRFVAGERGFSTPSPDVPAMVSWLLRSVEWLAHRTEIGQVIGTLSATVAECRRCAFPTGARRIPVADCALPVACDVASRAVLACPGRLWSPLPDSDLLPDLTCDTCGRVVAPAEWARGRGLVLSVAYAAALYGLSPTTLYRWVRSGRVKCVDGDVTRVRAADVERAARALQGVTRRVAVSSKVGA